jgi:hypothetical protein
VAGWTAWSGRLHKRVSFLSSRHAVLPPGADRDAVVCRPCVAAYRAITFEPCSMRFPWPSLGSEAETSSLSGVSVLNPPPEHLLSARTFHVYVGDRAAGNDNPVLHHLLINS